MFNKEIMQNVIGALRQGPSAEDQRTLHEARLKNQAVATAARAARQSALMEHSTDEHTVLPQVGRYAGHVGLEHFTDEHEVIAAQQPQAEAQQEPDVGHDQPIQ
jgi:hypothetical protein